MHGLSLVVVSRGCSPGAVRRLLIAVGSLVVEHRLSVVVAPRLEHAGLSARA